MMSVQTTFKIIWLTIELIREISACYLSFSTFLVCTNLIIILWNMPKLSKAQLNGGCIPKPSVSQSMKERTGSSSSHLCWILCLTIVHQDCYMPGSCHTPTPHPINAAHNLFLVGADILAAKWPPPLRKVNVFLYCHPPYTSEPCWIPRYS
jgi:hypothetical protein